MDIIFHIPIPTKYIENFMLLFWHALQQLANKKHREAERRIFGILDINKNTTIKEYTENF